MAKPKQLRRSAIAKAALAIIDNEGLESLTVRRLATELDIRAPTLYHHYADRDKILYDVVRIVFADNIVPTSRPQNALEAIVEACRDSYVAIAAHPNATPLFRVEYAGAVFREWYEHLILLLEEAGIAPQESMAVMLSIEALVTGLAADNAKRAQAEGSFDDDNLDQFPALREALEANSLGGVARVEKAVRSLLVGWLRAPAPKAGS